MAGRKIWQDLRDWFRLAEVVDSNGSRRRSSDRAYAHSGPAGGNGSGSLVLQNTGAVARIRSTDAPNHPTASRPQRNAGRELTSERDWGVVHGYGQIDGVGGAVIDGLFDVAVDETEMLDFLASDLDPIPADPAFRERLKEELWEMIAADGWTRPKDS